MTADRIVFVVNVGGQAARMGPWAPAPKPFLGVGPWSEEWETGDGPSCAWRWLRNYCRVAETILQGKSIASEVVLSIGYAQPAVAAESLELHSFFPMAALLPDDGPNAGTVAALHAHRYSGAQYIIMNGDDLVAIDSFTRFVEQALKTPNLLMTTEVEQRVEFGVVGHHPKHTRGEMVPWVYEKPSVGKKTIGCGVISISAETAAKAYALEKRTAPDVINMEPGIGQKFELFQVPPDHWATLTDPVRYMAACQAPTWRDANYREWREVCSQ